MHYIPLNIHTAYTFLNSCLKIEDIISIAKKNSFPFIGICDIDNAYAYPSFNQQCLDNNIKPIFGSTISIKINENDIKISLFVKNEIGYHNICHLLSNINNIDIKLIDEYKKGLIIVIPCKENSFIYNSFAEDKTDDIHKLIYSLCHGFDESYLGIELYQKEDKEVMKKVRTFAHNYSFSVIAFPLHLYETKHDNYILEILKAIKEDKKIDNNITKDGPNYFLSELAINTLYTKEEIQATHSLAESIDFIFNQKRGKLLTFNPDSLMDKKKFIKFKCSENMKKNHIPMTKEYIDRLNYELDTIEKMGYLDYFLIVSDYVNEAKKRKIPVGPGRGSAAGSLVSYCLGITEIDSLKYNLLFERFLNPERISMPDIDIDFADIYRDDIVKYIAKKYGYDCCANIVTFQTIGAKQAIRDIGRVLSFNNVDINTFANACKGNKLSLEKNRLTYPEFDKLCKDSYFSKIYDLAIKIEGFPRQHGIHPAGIILNDEKIEDIVPLTKVEDGLSICQYEFKYLEEQGFLKMDILSLRTLTIIDNIVKRVNSNSLKLDLKTIPLNDNKTFLTLNAGLTLGIFQIEKTDEFKRVIKEIKVESFNDIIAIIALYRPGPKEYIKTYAYNKNEATKINYIDSSLEDILSETYGVITYQEQIMQIVQKVASFSLGEADLFRRAISKKDEEKMLELKNKFIEGALKNHYQKEKAEKIYEDIYKFANYGFNKSHSVVYALISYQMAYLKAHYPKEYFSALLDTQSLADNKYIKYMNELSLFDISIALPNINYSTLEYRVKFNNIVIPFSAIKGLPIDIAKAIIYERNKNGNFINFIDFIKRMHDYSLTINHLTTLIDAGCFDIFNETRSTLKYNVKTLMDYVETTVDQISLLSEEEEALLMPQIIVVEENLKDKYTKEIETLGILLSGSLFSNYSSSITKYNAKSIKDAISSTSLVSIAVIISEIKIITTKKKQTMAILTCYDNTSLISVTLFNDIYEKEKMKLQKGNAVILIGRFKQDDLYGSSFYCNSIQNLEENK